MPCLTDEQFEQLAAGPDAAAPAPLQAHLRQCEACRRMLAQTRTDAVLVHDLRELREHREKVKPLVEAMPDSTGPGAPHGQDRA